MKDIKKMREVFEQELKYAEIENEVEARLGFEGFKIVGESLTQKGTLHTYFLHDLNREQAAQVLKTFQPTGRYKVSGKDIELTYRLETHRYPKEAGTTLKISWIHEDYDMTFEMLIDEQDETLMQYFRQDWRELDNSDIGLYYGAVSPREKSHLRNLRFLTFNCGNVIRYYGGYRLQISDGHACCIVADIIGE